jgi:hypothetical protein
MIQNHTDTPHSVGLLWTSDQPKRRDLFLKTHNTHNRHPCPQRDSNPQSKQASKRPQTHALYRAVTGTGSHLIRRSQFVHTQCHLKTFCRRQLRRYDCCNYLKSATILLEGPHDMNLTAWLAYEKGIRKFCHVASTTLRYGKLKDKWSVSDPIQYADRKLYENKTNGVHCSIMESAITTGQLVHREIVTVCSEIRTNT